MFPEQESVCDDDSQSLNYVTFETSLNNYPYKRGLPNLNDYLSSFYTLYERDWNKAYNNEQIFCLLQYFQRYLEKQGILFNLPDLDYEIKTYVVRLGLEDFKVNLMYDPNDSELDNLFNFYQRYKDNYQDYILHYQQVIKEDFKSKVISDKEILARIEQFKDAQIFFERPDNSLILKKYVAKYKWNFNKANLSDFFELITSKGFHGDYEILIYFIKDETQNQEYNEKYEKFCKQISVDNPQSIDDYIKNYLTFSKLEENNFNEYLPLFSVFLKGKGIIITIDDLKNKIDQEKLRQFEEVLLGDTEQKIITIDNIDRMSGEEFELVLKKIFEKKGYYVQTTPITGDQGADLIIKGFGEIVAVQAKNYTSNVGNGAIQEVAASIKHYNTNRGLVVTSSGFTISAIGLAKSNEIELWDREFVIKLLEAYPVRIDEV